MRILPKMSFDHKIKWLKFWKDLKDFMLCLFLLNLLINTLLGRVEIINQVVSVLQPTKVILEINSASANENSRGQKQADKSSVQADVESTDSPTTANSEDLVALANKIYLLESTNGKNNYSKCQAIGKVNGIGYGIWGDHWMCFDSHEEEMATLKKWITEKREKGLSDKELLCLYSNNNYSICK